MAETAERVAAKHGVTREESDRLALRSHQRASAAWNEGRFQAEVTPVALRGRRGDTQFARDEHIRTDASYEGLSALAPYFSESGLVTAGTASGIGDGSASMVIADAEWAKGRGLEPMGRLVSWAYVGVEPDLMGIGPVPAIREAVDRAGKRLEDMHLVEVNEAFAPQYLAVERVLGLDPTKTNVDGGAIALTHPLAASGARLLVHLLHELRRRGGGFGVVSACVGGGQGGAVVIEAFGAP
jgi:acetyl-CoA acetyltransferase family protein